MKTFEYVGPTAQLVGVGGAENGRVYGVSDELAPVLQAHPDFKKVTGVADEDVFDVLAPEATLLPPAGKPAKKPAKPKAAKATRKATKATSPAAPSDPPPNPSTTTAGPTGE